MRSNMDLPDRMKGYEAVSKSQLMPRTPAIIRIDGKAFHTWTKGLDRPFDTKFYVCMATTALELVEGIQGAVFAYGQSDEISILIRDYDTYETEQWFKGSIQKIASVSASMATAYFNQSVANIGFTHQRPLAMFDARVFSLPANEVENYFIWRQQDFLRNSVQSCARHYLGHKACQGLNRQQMIDAMREMEVPFDWYKDLNSAYQKGYVYCKNSGHRANFEIPTFSECREFIGIHV